MFQEFIEQLVAKADQRQMLDEGAYLFHQDDPVRSVFIVEEGLIELVRHQQDGTSIILQRAARQTVLAEASVYSKTYHCDAIVGLPSSLFRLSKAIFLEHLKNDEKFSSQWAEHLAREVQSARYRCELLSRKTVAGRLDGWLAWPGNEISSKGNWRSVALQIGVSPEALYRELAKRRSE